MSEEKWPHADLAIQWYSAPRGTLEWRSRDSGEEWNNRWEDKIAPMFYASYEYELRPIRKMEVMPEARVPAPLRVAPKRESIYWTFSFGCPRHFIWWGGSDDLDCLRAGLAFATQQDARDFLAAITARREE